jgi:putative NADH-flavin reductase
LQYVNKLKIMKIALIGATGFVGTALLNEALERGHEVVAIARNPEKTEKNSSLLTTFSASAYDVDAIVKAISGADLVLSAFNAGWANPDLYNDFLRGSEAIQEAAKKAGVPRLLVIGGAGSLEIAPGIQLVDTPDFPAEYKTGATAARDYLNILKKETELDWTFFSPAIEMHQGITTGRTGNYRIGTDNPVFNEEHRSILSVEDLAVAIIDEAEKHQFSHKRFTAAY